MKKILLILLSLLLIAVLIPTFAFAEGEDSAGEIVPETDGETVEVPKDLWDDLTALYEKITAAQSEEEIGEAIKATLFDRFAEWFGSDAAMKIINALTILVVAAMFLYEKYSKKKLLNGSNAVFAQNKALNKNVSDVIEKLKEELSAAKSAVIKSENASKIAAATLKMMNILIQRANIEEKWKSEASLIVAEVEKTLTESEV